MDLVVNSPDELLAAVPHLLGFNPEESIVLLPLHPGLPVTRVDMPKSTLDREKVWNALSGPYGRHARPGARVAILCFTEGRLFARLGSEDLSDRLAGLGITTHLRLWSDGDRWREFNSGATGSHTHAAAERIAAAAVLAGVAQPAVSRAALVASLVGNRAPIARLIPAARTAAGTGRPEAENEWALGRLDQFHADGNRLSDADGARMLVALETLSTRDALWDDVGAENTSAHVAIWSDLTRRSPDEVRAAPASLLGFACWMRGDGAKAWCALDQVPADPPYPMAAVVASALRDGIHPREWQRHQTQLRDMAREVDESFVPKPIGRPRDQLRTQPNSDRPAPGR
ncbi:hypothetical protein ASE01_17015 [Nocardioides sp. Root190]|uniref:DUF4192 domain-containing protein n=1 Tax=Nocardioides sp. Root190 TaxID=1736488 RepID=UPI0006F64C76|nr:DUF4192 domain-containing protein [Nocardioides sp. Root190]KRB75065.1 hypothetical protein ASE01_17015 [Nocardioides sp. Root190]